MGATPVFDDALSPVLRISEFAKDGLGGRLGRLLRALPLSLASRNVDPAAGCWLPYLGRISGKQFLLQRNEAARAICGKPSMPHCLAVRVNFVVRDGEEIANDEGPVFDQLAIDLTHLICRSGIGVHVATITVQGIRLFVFYCREPLSREQLLETIRGSFDPDRVSVRCKPDPRWTLYRAMA